ncbi:nitrite reductase [Ferrimonas lipolytica]|uniref:Nitrite reductase n=2 Tax=Ferrimonas lipolytica TaxID=2724191 RepID=A0A6H1UKP7_9GAMM|nr:nitrite reductase [Ferrimonas lipolytica]
MSVCFGVAAQASADKKCMMCHKKNGTMLGIHSTINNISIGCVSCHGEKGKHPRDKTALRYFGLDSHTPASEQNLACMSCHQLEQLRQSEWTHDVHLSKLSCAACHQLHPERDPIDGISAHDRSQACADCHSQFNGEAEQ